MNSTLRYPLQLRYIGSSIIRCQENKQKAISPTNWIPFYSPDIQKRKLNKLFITCVCSVCVEPRIIQFIFIYESFFAFCFASERSFYEKRCKVGKVRKSIINQISFSHHCLVGIFSSVIFKGSLEAWRALIIGRFLKKHVRCHHRQRGS